MSDWKPGKGIFMAGNEQTLDFLHECIEDIYNALAGDEDGQVATEGWPSLNVMIDTGRAQKVLNWITGSATGWRKEQTDLGPGVVKEIEWADQADGKPTKYRITVLVDKRGKLKFDIRQWYKERE